MGRTTSSEQLVDALDASEEAKMRLRAVLANLAGEATPAQAGERVGVAQAMFYRFRRDSLQAAAERLEPRAGGRPAATTTPEEERIALLEAKVRELELELAASRVREEIAVSMPFLVKAKEVPRTKKAGAVGDPDGGSPSAPPPAAIPLTSRERHEKNHLERLHEACRLRGMEKKPRSIRGEMIQHERRKNERDIRKAALAFWTWAQRCRGTSGREAARYLRIPEGTLRAWMLRWDLSKLQPTVRGRPCKRPDALTRTAILVMFYVMGPGVGVATVQELFPDVGRAAIVNLLRRYANMSRRRKRRMIRGLRWYRPGRVWAMDYTEAPSPIDGTFRWCLLVRDLASGNMLLALPVTNATAQQTAWALESLFRSSGVPLVMKCDLGGHFIAETVQQLLARHQVTALLSPGGLPEYNGAIEAGGGSVKTRAEHLAARHGRPGEWTCDDVEGSRMEANLTGRPRGFLGTTPEAEWQSRTPLSEMERTLFLGILASMRDVVRAERGYLPGIELDDMTKRALERMAVVRTLMECGYLEIRRSRIPLQQRPAERA